MLVSLAQRLDRLRLDHLSLDCVPELGKLISLFRCAQ